MYLFADDQEATAIGEENVDAHSLLNQEHDRATSTVGLSVDGPNFVNVYINPRLSANKDIAQFLSGQNETANSTSFGEYLPQNPTNGESRSPVRADHIQPQGQRDVDPCISRVSNLASTAKTKSTENACKDRNESGDARPDAPIENPQMSESNSAFPDSTELGSSNATEVYTEESSDAPSLEVMVKDVLDAQSVLPNSTSTNLLLKLIVDFDGTDTLQTRQSSNPTGESSSGTLQTTKSSNPTEESSTETTMTGSSGSSSLNHSESNIQSSEQSAENPRSSNFARCVESTSSVERALKVESTEAESSDPELPIPQCFEPAYVDRIKEDIPTHLRMTHQSDSKDSSTAMTDRNFASGELERSFGSSRSAAIGTAESSKISEDLETIQEVSSCSESPKEALPRAASSRAVLPKSVETSYSPQSVSHSHPTTDIKKTSRRARIASRLSSGFKRFFHGIRMDRTPRSSREELHPGLHTESVHSVSAGETLPAGHSTLVPEDDRLLKNFRRRRSVSSYVCLPRPLDDPRILLHDRRNVAESGLRVDEQPLDLSIRSSSVREEKYKDPSACEEQDFNCTSDGTKEVLCDGKEYLRPRISVISEAGMSSSVSLKSKRDTRKPVERDGNHNFLSASSTAVHDANLDENRECIRDSKPNFNFPRTNDVKLKPRSFKNIFKFGNRDRGEVSCFGRKRTGANSVPAEFQRNSAGPSSRPGEHRNAKFESTTFESRADSNSYQELDFGIPDDERNLRERCTEL